MIIIMMTMMIMPSATSFNPTLFSAKSSMNYELCLIQANVENEQKVALALFKNIQ